MKNRKITILLIIINIILIGVIISLINKNGIIKEKQIIKEMSESTQVTELNNQITALNKAHTEYSNYIQTCKTQIAKALTNEGVTTSDQATLETMSENIGKILQARTADATATADNVTEGKTAYVNGEKLIGNGSNFGFDNIVFYDTLYNTSNNMAYSSIVIDVSKANTFKCSFTISQSSFQFRAIDNDTSELLYNITSTEDIALDVSSISFLRITINGSGTGKISNIKLE